MRAYHEAGHAVVDRRVGHTIKSVSITIMPAGDGFVRGVAYADGTEVVNNLKNLADLYDPGDVEEDRYVEILAGYWAGWQARCDTRRKGCDYQFEDDLGSIRMF